MLACAAGNAQAIVSCLVEDNQLSFGAYVSPNGPANLINSTVKVTCQLTPVLDLLGLVVVGCESDSYTVQLSPGNGGSYAPRKMYSGLATLDYNLYIDSGYASVWGNGTGGSQTVTQALAGSLLGNCQPSVTNHTVYGRIPGSQNVPAGSYSDAITVTVTFD